MTAPLGPDFELQKAMAALLATSSDLQGLIGNSPMRLYQDVPKGATFPYVTIGQSQVVPDTAECIDGSEVLPVLHIWSRDSSFKEAKQISATIWAALSGGTLTLTENRCVLFERDQLGDIALRDPDGVTVHVASHYRALMEPV